jgi:hypothetical protein
MNTRLMMLAKCLVLTIVTIAVFSFSGGVARADDLAISGTTSGIVTGVPQLVFGGNPHFFGTTEHNVGALSGINNLGSFFLNAGDSNLVAGTFTLNIVFESPSTINGGQGTTYLASIQGSISPDENHGGLHIHFANPTQLFTFSNGSFSLTVNDVFVQTAESGFITAGFTGQQTRPVPEPVSLLLLGSGLTGLAARLRKKKQPRPSST